MVLAKITCNKNRSRILGEFFIIMAAAIMFLGRHAGILNTVIFEYKQIKLLGWGLSHFIFFFIVGLICTKQPVMFMVIGICWELFEYFYGHLTNDVLYWTSGGIQGQLMDILMNFLGYMSAQLLSYYI